MKSGFGTSTTKLNINLHNGKTIWRSKLRRVERNLCFTKCGLTVNVVMPAYTQENYGQLTFIEGGVLEV